MLKGKTLLDYTNLFSPNDFKKNDQVIKRIFKKMNNYRLNEISKIKDYFNHEINERKYKRRERRKRYDIIKII